MKLWVKTEGQSDCLAIFFKIGKTRQNPPIPLMFNHLWLLEEDYQKQIKEFWDLLCPMTTMSYMQQMVDNIAKVKSCSKKWIKKYKETFQAQLKEVEEKIKIVYDEIASGVFTPQNIDELT